MPYGGPRGGVVSYERCTPIVLSRVWIFFHFVDGAGQKNFLVSQKLNEFFQGSKAMKSFNLACKKLLFDLKPKVHVFWGLLQVTGKVQSKYDRLVARSVDVTTDLEAQVMSPLPPTGYGYSVGPYGIAYRRGLQTTCTRSWYPYPVSSRL